jgi:hypothetical protein
MYTANPMHLSNTTAIQTRQAENNTPQQSAIWLLEKAKERKNDN